MFVLLISMFLIALLFYLYLDSDGCGEVKSLANWPLFGNMLGTFTQKEHFRDILQRAYNAFPDQRYFLFRNFTSPVVVIRDLDLIKQITIRDFNYFEDHVGGVDVKIDPLFGNNLFSLKGNKWHEMRYTLSPAFTSSKMKEMLEYLEECADQMVNYYLGETSDPIIGDTDYLEVEVKEAFTRYTNDVIASVAFGIKVNSLLDRNSEFYEMGKMAISQTRLKPEFTRLQILKQIVMASFPRIAKHFRGPVFSPSVSSFFKGLVRTTMRTRKEHNIVRRDLIQLLMEAKAGLSKKLPDKENESEELRIPTAAKSEWTNDEITAQAMIFFISGFETSSTFLSFLAYELTKNSEVQKRLQIEIDETAEETGGTIDNTTLQNMKYMKMVVYECLRMWPTVISTDRKCSTTYKLPSPSGSTEKVFTLNPNDAIWIPIYGIHHDPKYHTDPEKFDPERFSEERIKDIKPLSYLPFGLGARACIGNRFALMETKIVIFKLLRHFDFVVIKKTQIPAKLKNNSFNLHCENGIWIGLRKRTQIN